MTNINAFLADGDPTRIVIIAQAGSNIHVFLLIMVEVFMVGAKITSEGDKVAKALRDLSLHMPSATSEHVVAVLNRLQAHAETHPPAFKPYGWTVNIGTAVASLNIVMVTLLAMFVEHAFYG